MAANVEADSQNRMVEYTDAATGAPIEMESFIDETRAGEVLTKRIAIKNVNIYPIQLTEPRSSGLNILSYPTEVIQPGQTKEMEIEIDVPPDAVTPPTGAWEFRVAVIAVG